MPDAAQQSRRWKLWWVLLTIAVMLVLTAVFIIWLPYHRQQRAIEDILATARPAPTHTFKVVRQASDGKRWGDRITIVPGGPQWLRRVVGDRFMGVFETVERVGLMKSRGANRAVEYLPRLHQLKHLVLYGSDITDTGLVAVAECRQLEGLSLMETRITDSGLIHLKQLRRLKYLTVGSELTNKGLGHLGNCPQLEELTLSCPNVTDAGLVHLTKLKQLRRLQIMDGGKISDDGLVQIGKLRRLEHLLLDQTAISDRGLEHLKGLTGLRVLWIRYAAISDTGIVHLKHLPKLEDLMVGYTDVTQKGIDELKRALPGLEAHGVESQRAQP